MTITQVYQLRTIDINEFGYSARLYFMSETNGKERWTVNFPQPLISATQQELERYNEFIQYVLFYLQELNS